MAFKIYKNRKTKHPSISIKSGDKQNWHNLEATHSPRKQDRYIEKDDVNLVCQFASPCWTHIIWSH